MIYHKLLFGSKSIFMLAIQCVLVYIESKMYNSNIGKPVFKDHLGSTTERVLSKNCVINNEPCYKSE